LEAEFMDIKAAPSFEFRTTLQHTMYHCNKM